MWIFFACNLSSVVQFKKRLGFPSFLRTGLKLSKYNRTVKIGLEVGAFSVTFQKYFAGADVIPTLVFNNFVVRFVSLIFSS